MSQLNILDLLDIPRILKRMEFMGDDCPVYLSDFFLDDKKERRLTLSIVNEHFPGHEVYAPHGSCDMNDDDDPAETLQAIIAYIIERPPFRGDYEI